MKSLTAAAFLLLTIGVTTSLGAQAKPAAVDSSQRYHITTKRVVKTGAFILLAASADLTVRHWSQSHRTAAFDDIAGVGNVLGSPGYVMPPLVMTYLMGRITHRPRVATSALHAGEAVLLAGSAGLVLKLAIGRERPYQNGGMANFHPFHAINASFPSGHTTVAFAVATSLAQDHAPGWLHAVWYGAAVTTAFARINDDQHWFSDVVAGAVIGHLAGRIAASQPGRITITPGPASVRIRVAF